MTKAVKAVKVSELPISLADFLESFNKNMPSNFPRASVGLLNQFKAAHDKLFAHGDSWSLERHRKRLMDWLPRVLR